MRRVMVRYMLKPGQAELNEKLVKAVYEELAEVKPAGFRYATVRLDDGLTFVHIAVTEVAENPLPSIEAFKRFTEGIADRCEVPPQTTEFDVVGSYGLSCGPSAA
jgi:hypothetical protein